MPNEKIVSHRDLQQLLKSETYRLYYQLKQDILKDYPPPKQRTREQSLEVSRRISDLMWEPEGPFQLFLWEQMSEQERTNQDRRALNKKPGGKRGPKIKDEEY
jgi:hypothetical protein